MRYKVWKGTDALTLCCFPPGNFLWYFRIVGRRLKWFLIHRFFEHVVVSQNLGFYLTEFGIQKYTIVSDAPIITGGIRRIQHTGCNILYYYPGARGNRRFKQWVYGHDLFQQLTLDFPDINFVVVDGSQDMEETYSTIDGYIRPNRHDGEPRMVLECQNLDIPYCTSNNSNELSRFIKEIYESICDNNSI